MRGKLLCLGLLLLGIAGNTSVVSGEKANKEPTISVAIAKMSSGDFDGSRIEKKLDEYVYSTLGFHIKMEYLEYTKVGEILGKYVLTDEFPDVFLVTSSSDYEMLVTNDYLMPLNKLLDEYGKELTEACGQQALESHMEPDGECYAIPCIHERAWAPGFEYREEYAREYGLDMESVETIDDLTEIFAQLKEKNPDIVPVGSIMYYDWDALGDGLGVLMELGQSEEIVNLYETEEYEYLCKTFSKWREEGYMLDEDYVSANIGSFVNSPEIFGKLGDYKPSMQWMDEKETGEKMQSIALNDGVIFSNAYERDLWTVSAGTSYPEEAMKFLNALYSDENMANLLANGIENEDYKFQNKEQQIICQPDSAAKGEKVSFAIRDYLVGNQYLSYKWNNYPSDIWEQCKEFDTNAALSNGYGFKFDSAPVKEQVRVCTEIVNLYHPLLFYGTSDVDVILSEFQRRLRMGGIDDIVKEKKRQYAMWKNGES